MPFRDLTQFLFWGQTSVSNSGVTEAQLIQTPMGHLPTRWNALAVVLALATMLGCQGLSTSKSNIQTTQTPGVLSAAPTSLSFQGIRVGTFPTLSDTLTNTGASSLTITQANVTGTGFSINGLSLPLILAPNQSATFTVVFGPQAAGTVSGNVALINDGATSPLNITLSGAAANPADLIGTPASFSFGNVQIGTNQTQTETLKNTGGANITVSQASVTGTGFSYTG